MAGIPTSTTSSTTVANAGVKPRRQVAKDFVRYAEPEHSRAPLPRSLCVRTCELLDRAQDFFDVGRDEWVVRDPHPANGALSIEDVDSAPAHAEEASEWGVFCVRDAELRQDAAIEVAQQWELEVQALGERGVCAVALDAQSQDARAKLDETGVVLTEPL